MDTGEHEHMLSREQTAVRLSVSRATVDRLRQTGQLTTVKVSRRRVAIPAGSVDAYLARCQEGEASCKDVGGAQCLS